MTSPTAGRYTAEQDLSLDAATTVRILHRFLSREVGRTGLNHVVLGLSGGIDSALVAALAAGALGPDRVHAVCMPYRSSSPESLKDAMAVIEMLGIHHETVDISPAVDGLTAVSPGIDAHRLGNVMARCRMTLLYDRSMTEGALVLGTSNKTEILLGYGTLHGDLASAINPIGDLYKTQVRELSAYLELPRAVLEKPPSADLIPGQSDELDLGFSYDEVDRLLALLIDARISRDGAIGAGFPGEMIDRVETMIVRSQFKRRLPVIAKLSTRSVGWDFRYPRDWRS
jgi:NAD+ synthase